MMLPRAIIRPLSEEEMAAYRAPYHDREARLAAVWRGHYAYFGARRVNFLSRVSPLTRPVCPT
jgi:hypothetical protein